jgi:hypothetical protein
MARFTKDREDLLLEATALVPRVMLRMTLLCEPCEVFAGFRGQSLSVYFDASPVYHFNRAGELRRAFIDDQLVKAEQGRLVGTVRERSPTAVVLASTPLSGVAVERLAAGLCSRLAEVRGNLNRGEFELVGQTPPGGEGVDRLRAWLAAWSGFRIAAVANVNS